ncbi:MAG: hypothetical protein BEN19_02030 [Epulopiscium sp. Nuni2H_MBin003]|nr:MAG: hypothetical protein BEN19_02030 [Epulopiscium sp. Nuni2H_MBin003]
MNKSVTIIGAGASGLISAIVLARAGINVIILEKQSKIGKKILTTGNGRCNMTNVQLSEKYFHATKTLEPILQFNEQDTMDFFSKLGIVPIIKNNKVYPASLQATSIVDVLKLEIESLGINVITDTCVTQIEYKNNSFKIYSQELCFTADTIIVATGGLAGVSENYTIYNILEKLGHKIETLAPTIVHVVSNSPHCKALQGIRIDSNVKIFYKDIVKEEYGEVLFTADGLSGPAIFNVSRVASVASINKEFCYLELDLFKDLDFDKVVQHIYERIEIRENITIEELFIGWINKKVGISIIKSADIGKPTRYAKDLEYFEVEKLVYTLKHFKFIVKGTRGFKFAQSTIGGVSLEDINMHTMKSKIVPDMYIIGEVLDVDGDCGGYNLQWAWSSGVTAARSIIRSKND